MLTGVPLVLLQQLPSVAYTAYLTLSADCAIYIFLTLPGGSSYLIAVSTW